MFPSWTKHAVIQRLKNKHSVIFIIVFFRYTPGKDLEILEILLADDV